MAHRRLATLVLVVTALAAPSTSANAQTVKIGSANTAANCIPFTCASGFDNIPADQQVFASSIFSQMVAISEIDFFRSSAGSGDLAGGTFNLYLGYTNKAVNGLSTNLASNPSGAMTLFASFVGGGPVPTVLSFTGGPFVYDPSQGNLLLEIDNANWSEGGDGDMQASVTAQCGRAFNSTVGGNANDGTARDCLDTEFHFAPVSVTGTPEPSAVVLMASGFIGVAGFAQRRQRAERA